MQAPSRLLHRSAPRLTRMAQNVIIPASSHVRHYASEGSNEKDPKSKMSSLLRNLRKGKDTSSQTTKDAADEEPISVSGEATPSQPFADNTPKSVPKEPINSTTTETFHIFNEQEGKEMMKAPREVKEEARVVDEAQVKELLDEVRKGVQDAKDAVSAAEEVPMEKPQTAAPKDTQKTTVAPSAETTPNTTEYTNVLKGMEKDSKPETPTPTTSSTTPKASITASNVVKSTTPPSTSTTTTPIFTSADIDQAKEIMDSFENAHISVYKEPTTFVQRINHFFYKFTLYTKWSLYAAAVFTVLYLLYQYKRFEARLKHRYENIRGEVERRVTNKVAHFFSDEGLVGLCVSIMMNDELCQDIALGFANMEQFSKCDAQKTLMSLGLGGINDALIVYGIGRMVEEGLLRLDRVGRVQVDESGVVMGVRQFEGDNVVLAEGIEDEDKQEKKEEEVEPAPLPVDIDETTAVTGSALDPQVDLELETFQPSKVEPPESFPPVAATPKGPALPSRTVAETLKLIKDSSRSQQDYYNKLYAYVAQETQVDFNDYILERVLEKRFNVGHIFPDDPTVVIPHRASAYRRATGNKGNLSNCPVESVPGHYVATTRDLCLLGQGFQRQPLLATTFSALGTILAPSVKDWNALSNYNATSQDPHNAGSSALLISPEFNLVVASASNSSDVNLLPLASQIAEEYAQISAIDEDYHRGTAYHLYHRGVQRVKRWFGSE